MTRSNARGFTLVELAIALMVIGLLIGGVLKGQELIENAKVTSTLRQIKAYDAATMIFFNAYGAYPGDIKKPQRIANCTEEICNTPGNGNGRVDSGEAMHFFPQMITAGIVKKTSDDTQAGNHTGEDESLYYPNTALDFTLGVQYVGNGMYSGDATRAHIREGVHYWTIDKPTDDEGSWVPGKIMLAIDEKIDDGRPITGSVVVSYQEVGVECPIDPVANEYDMAYSQSWQECYFLIGAGF